MRMSYAGGLSGERCVTSMTSVTQTPLAGVVL